MRQVVVVQIQVYDCFLVYALNFIVLNPIQDGHFLVCSRMGDGGGGGGKKGPPSLKSVTHILQR